MSSPKQQIQEEKHYSQLQRHVNLPDLPIMKEAQKRPPDNLISVPVPSICIYLVILIFQRNHLVKGFHRIDISHLYFGVQQNIPDTVVALRI